MLTIHIESLLFLDCDLYTYSVAVVLIFEKSQQKSAEGWAAKVNATLHDKVQPDDI